jgi:hypothetical protein
MFHVPPEVCKYLSDEEAQRNLFELFSKKRARGPEEE